MATLFLLLIYLSFISLGLPDSLFGAAWPVMRLDFGAPLGMAGVLSMITALCTVVSSLASERLTRRFGTGKVTAFSVLATAVALLGYALAPAFGWMLLLCVPLGLGAGSVDAALNNYVALHYAARHMNWLHCFWGIGASLGPAILSAFIQAGKSWRGGYFTISIIQFVVCALLFLSLPLWGRQNQAKGAALALDGGSSGAQGAPAALPASKVIRMPGVLPALATFMLYCAIEAGGGLWISSYLVGARGFSAASGALGSALYFGGITAGRFLNGFLSSRFSGENLIRAGGFMMLSGIALLAVPLPGLLPLVPTALIGLGCAPIYPSMIHLTPRRFGASVSQKVIGWQMASAYTGTSFLPPLIGLVCGRAGVAVLPWLLLPLTVLMLLCSDWVRRAAPTKKTQAE